jgi:predicted glutamine amidotransferase
MCIIAVSRQGVKQPTLEQLRRMYNRNPDGAGYMFARGGKVYIHKGFMTFEDFSRNIKQEHFTKADPVVYHFRISTQAGVSPEMTHPFPLTPYIEDCEYLDCSCDIGVAHNGIIRMTSCANNRYSDTALFITRYMSKLIRDRNDISDSAIKIMIDQLTNSKWAIMDGITGDIATVGDFYDEDGLLFSNSGYRPPCKSVTNTISEYMTTT